MRFAGVVEKELVKMMANYVYRAASDGAFRGSDRAVISQVLTAGEEQLELHVEDIAWTRKSFNITQHLQL